MTVLGGEDYIETVAASTSIFYFC